VAAFLVLAALASGVLVHDHETQVSVTGLAAQATATGAVATMSQSAVVPGRIERQGPQLEVDGKPFTFVGVNAYELGTWSGVDNGCGADFSQEGLNAFFSTLPAESVVRTWAWQGEVGTAPISHQRTWVALDRLVSTAGNFHVRLILSLGPQDGTCDSGHWDDVSWYSGGYRQRFNDNGDSNDSTSYLTWVEQVVSRYRENPTIAMWEPINEPEAAACLPGYLGNACYDGATCPNEHSAAVALRSFFDAVGGEIHRLDPGSLVESGEIGSGQCGTAGSDAAYVESSPGIDVTSVHDYGADTTALPGDSYNGEKVRLAQTEAVGKPIIVGEMGIDSGGVGCVDGTRRLAEFQHKIGAALFAGFSGALVWDWVPSPQPGCSPDVGPSDPFMVWLRAVGPEGLGRSQPRSARVGSPGGTS
jgi:mannan endo-1,4-beta-mannosidase